MGAKTGGTVLAASGGMLLLLLIAVCHVATTVGFMPSSTPAVLLSQTKVSPSNNKAIIQRATGVPSRPSPPPTFARSRSSRASMNMSTKLTAQPPKLIISGAPASGKGTQCELITQQYGCVHLSTGDMLREAVKDGTALGTSAKGFMDSGQLVPDEVITGVVTDRLAMQDCQEKGWLLDGFPRTKAQAEALAQAGALPDAFILLNVPEKDLVERVVGRRTDPETGKIYHTKFFPAEDKDVEARLVQRSDDTEEKVKVRLVAFQKHRDEVLQCYDEGLRVEVDGTKSKDEVFQTITTALGPKGGAATTTSTTSTSPAPGPGVVKTAASLAAIVFADTAAKRLFLRLGWSFPASLGGMLALFALLLVLSSAKSTAGAAEGLASSLQPGSAFLSRWLPVFFVPSLITLPLSPALSGADAARLGAVVVGGYLFSLLSTAKLVTLLSGGGKAPAVGDTAATAAATAPASASSSPPPRAFSKTLQGSFFTAAVGTGSAAAVIARRAAEPSLTVLSMLRSACMLSTTLLTYTVGVTSVPKKVKALVHPLVTCTALTLSAAHLLARASGVASSLTFTSVLQGYVTQSKCPVHLGAGNILLGLLGPSILSFALQMYQRRQLLRENLGKVLGATLYAAASGLFGTAALARGLSLSPSLRLSALSRQITSPLALAIAGMLGAQASMAVAIVVVTGVLGANFGATLLSKAGVEDPVARGLAQGASAHGLGTAAMVNEPSAFAFAALSMALTATFSTLLVSVGPVKKLLLKLAVGAP